MTDPVRLIGTPDTGSLDSAIRVMRAVGRIHAIKTGAYRRDADGVAYRLAGGEWCHDRLDTFHTLEWCAAQLCVLVSAGTFGALCSDGAPERVLGCAAYSDPELVWSLVYALATRANYDALGSCTRAVREVCDCVPDLQ